MFVDGVLACAVTAPVGVAFPLDLQPLDFAASTSDGNGFAERSINGLE